MIRHSVGGAPRRRRAATLLRAAAGALALSLTLGGCGSAGPKAPPAGTSYVPAAAIALQGGGIALLTPTAGFGQEENKQAVAVTFNEALAKLRPDLRAVPLAQTLSAVNAAGLSESYDKMYVPYRNTGLFDRDLLRLTGAAVGARYLVQLKVQGVNQSSKQRFGYFGINLLQTQIGQANLFAQIWDANDGRLVWEGSSESVRQRETFRERKGTAQMALQEAAEDLVRQLPR